MVLFLALLFAAPLLIALVLRVSGWQPGATANHGSLIEPPVSLPAGALGDPLSGYWVLIAPCRADCVELAERLARVRRALGKDSGRVRLLLSGPERPPGDPGAAPLAVAPDSLRRALRSADVSRTPGSVLLVDPRGFLVMRYAPGFQESGLLDDLERLLRYDRVGVQQ